MASYKHLFSRCEVKHGRKAPKILSARQHHDRSFGSVCLKCFATVANACDLEELQVREREHACDHRGGEGTCGSGDLQMAKTSH